MKLRTIVPKRAWALGFAIALAGSLTVPALAFASVTIDDVELTQGENAVGGGTATWVDQVIDVVNVTAEAMIVDSEDVSINFDGENKVEHIYATGDADVTVAVNEHNEFDSIEAEDSANITVNVTGENDIEAIQNFGTGDITIRGTDCQKKDILNIEDDDYSDNAIYADKGNVTIDHVTVNMNGERGVVSSNGGNVVIDTSKIASGDDTKDTWILAFGTLLIKESVIDIIGMVNSGGKMTINHSDVKVEKAADDGSPYRVWSFDDIELINEKNGEVKDGAWQGDKVRYLDTGDGDTVDLEADGKPAYYKCKDDDASTKGMPKTGDENTPLWPGPLALASIAVAGLALRRRETSQ